VAWARGCESRTAVRELAEGVRCILNCHGGASRLRRAEGSSVYSQMWVRPRNGWLGQRTGVNLDADIDPFVIIHQTPDRSHDERFGCLALLSCQPHEPGLQAGVQMYFDGFSLRFQRRLSRILTGQTGAITTQALKW